MANVRYENFIIENKMKSLLETKLGVKSLMTIDNSLVEEAGMKKKVHTYVFNGTVADVAEGEGNTGYGDASYTAVEYAVVTTQGRFKYSDEDAMTDPFLIDTLLKGQAEEMVRDLNTKYFAELEKGTLTVSNAGFGYDQVVDAIAKMNIEDESGLFILVGTDMLAKLRKSNQIVSANLGAVVFDGVVGTVAGVPVILSRKVPAKKAYVAHKEAVTYFTKKEVSVPQPERLENTRENVVYIRKVGVMALTDATKVVKITDTTA